jgi:hypothetical protein
MLASVDPGPAIGDAGVAIDEAVNDTVPGGWATVGAVAVAIAAPYALPALGAEAGAAGFVGLDAATAAELGLSGGSALGTAGAAGDVLAGIAGLEAAGAGAGSGFVGLSPEFATELGLAGGSELGTAGAAGDVLAGLPTAGEGFVGLSPEYAAELGLEGGSGLGIEGAAGDPLASLEGLDEIANAQYPGDSQYEIQDVQEQARATDVKPGSPTSWDTGESLIPQELKDALDAANKARQAYNIGRTLLGGTGGAMTMPTLGQYIMPGMGMGAGSTGVQNMGIPNLQAGLVRGQPIDLNIDQFNAPLAPINAAEGGYIQHYAAAGEVDSYVDTNYQDTVTGLTKLKPNLMKGKSDFGLQKYWNPPQYADGGSIEGHNPEFFSEGGLQNRYVKGAGDGTSDDVPAMLANGEFVIPADVVSSLGNGSNDSGAHLLDEFLQVIREHKRKADAKDLPPDSKGPLGYLLEAKRKAR